MSEPLRIKDTKVGEGKTATRGASIKVHYEGFLENGTKFDSSLDRKKAYEFKLGAGKVIRGWDVGFEGMKEGGKRTLHIPYHLGYGSQSVGKIPAKSNLIFHVELLEVKN